MIITFVDDLNRYFCRFDVDDKQECDEICNNLSAGSSIDITEEAIAKSLSKLRPNTATGPDGLKARLLKNCAPQLKGVFSRLFKTLSLLSPSSLISCRVTWESADVKKPCSTSL